MRTQIAKPGFSALYSCFGLLLNHIFGDEVDYDTSSDKAHRPSGPRRGCEHQAGSTSESEDTTETPLISCDRRWPT